jgi:hypothetical protein
MHGVGAYPDEGRMTNDEGKGSDLSGYFGVRGGPE